MLRMYGHTARLLRYLVRWKMDQLPMEQGCCSQEEVDHLLAWLEKENQVLKGAKEPLRNQDITVEPVEQAEHEWIDGRAFDTLEQARQALQAGEQAYQPPISTEQQLAVARAEISNLQAALARLVERSELTHEAGS